MVVAIAHPAYAQPAGPVIECEVIEQAGYHGARYRISNPGGLAVRYRFAAVIDNGGNAWRSDPVAGIIDPGAEAVHEFLPFPEAVAIDRCGTSIAPATAPPPPTPEGIRVEDGPVHAHPVRALGGLVLGSAAAVGLGIGGAYLGMRLECWDGCPAIVGGVFGSLLGGGIGYLAGTTVGVGLAWHHEGGSNPLGAAFGGSLLGGMIGIGFAVTMQDEDRAVIVALAGPLLGATIAVVLTHRHLEDNLAVGALFELRDGELAAGIPIPTHATIDGAAVTTVPLFGGRF